MSPGPSPWPITKEFKAIVKSARLEEKPQQEGEEGGIDVVVILRWRDIRKSVTRTVFKQMMQTMKELFPPPSKYIPRLKKDDFYITISKSDWERVTALVEC